MFLYTGGDPTTKTPNEMKEIMEEWDNWIEECGDAVVDSGSPMGNGISVVDDGTEDDSLDITGYSIMQAQNLSEAKRLTAHHPHLREGEGDATVDIFEIFPIKI